MNASKGISVDRMVFCYVKQYSRAFKGSLCLVVLYVTIIAKSNCLYAQSGWKNVSSQYGTLPQLVEVYENTDSIEGRPNRSIYISLPLKSKSYSFDTRVSNAARKTPQQYFEENDKPLVVVNGTFFSFATNSNLNVVMSQKKLKAFNVVSVQKKGDSTFTYVSRSALGITSNGKADVAWLFTDSSRKKPVAFQQAPIAGLKGSTPHPKWKEMKRMLKANNLSTGATWHVKTAIGGGPMLVQNGAVKITNREEWMFANGENDKHPRTAMGYTADGRLIILMTEGRNPGKAEGISLVQMANMLISIGCVEALNLDGGGSSCMLINGIETIKPSDKEGQRAVPAVFMVQWQ